MLTYAIPQRDVLPLAELLLQRFGNLAGVLAAEPSALNSIEGIKANTTVLLKLIDLLRRKISSTVAETEKPHENPTQTLDVPPLSDFKLAPLSIESKPKKNLPPIRPRTDIFSQSVLRESIRLLPSFPQTDSLEEIRAFLLQNLHYSSANTRRRYIPYITHRLFPDDKVSLPLIGMAKTYAETPELREICFYRFCRSEPLMPKVIADLILPNIGFGRLTRNRIESYLIERYPEAKNLENCTKAIVDALTAGGIVNPDRLQLSFAWRPMRLASFAFILHDEFNEPGIYDIRKAETNSYLACLLWAPEKILQGLYELRNQGLISKVSEIDTVRQFTLRYQLPELVQILIEKGKAQ